MDAVDKKILTLLSENARLPLKELAEKVALSSPAVSQRLKKMEDSGLIAGYTLRLSTSQTRGNVRALISLHVPPKERGGLREIIGQEPAVEECYQVTGNYSHMVKVSCRDIAALESLISRLQKLGQTSTQIILSTIRGAGLVLPE